MELTKILYDAIRVFQTNESYDDFESQITLNRVVEFIKWDTPKLSQLSGKEYKLLFIVLTNMLVSEYYSDKETNTTFVGIAFYSAYRCLSKAAETGEKLYDDNYTNTNNLLFIYGHDNLTDILQNAKASTGSPYNPLTNLDIYGAEEEIYQMEYTQYLNNPRITNSENLYIDRLNEIRRYIPNHINDRFQLNRKLRNNQDIIYKYLSELIEDGEYEF